MDFEKYYSDRQKLINNFLEKRMQKKAFPAWMKPWHTAFLQAASAYARFF